MLYSNHRLRTVKRLQQISTSPGWNRYAIRRASEWTR